MVLLLGQIRVHDPASDATSTALTLPVYSGGEDGLVSLALAPDFATSNHLYVYYSPAGTAEVTAQQPRHVDTVLFQNWAPQPVEFGYSFDLLKLTPTHVGVLGQELSPQALRTGAEVRA